MNGKYYNNPTFPDAEEEETIEEEKTEIKKKTTIIYASFPSENEKDKVFKGTIKHSSNDLIKLLTSDNRVIIIPCKYINYIEHIK